MKNYKYSSSFFLGETTHGLNMPVFYDLHTPIVNDRPPGCLITGAPGSGKTFLAQTLCSMSAIAGKTTVVFDPKGDFIPLINLSDEIGEPVIWNLAKGMPGLLDPFYMTSDPNDKLTLVIDVIDIFLGGLKSNELAVLSPIVKDVIASPIPSLQKVVDELRGSPKEVAQDLGTQLDLIRKMNFARLCFAPGNIKRPDVSISKGLTIVSMVGLELPKSTDNMTRKERLASGVLFLLTDFVRRIMADDKSPNPKVLIIDEAHAVVSSEAGARVVKDIALLGRSRYLALVLVTQNNSHLKNLDIENTISTRFAFKSDSGEAANIIKAMDLPSNEGFESIITGLEKGEALMKDFMKRYSTVQISAWKTDWLEAFNTNPLDRLRKAKLKEEQEKAKQSL